MALGVWSGVMIAAAAAAAAAVAATADTEGMPGILPATGRSFRLASANTPSASSATGTGIFCVM